MSTESSKPLNAVEAVGQLVALLQSLNSEERRKAISAALILLGDQLSAVPVGTRSGGGQGYQPNGESVEGLSPKASTWATKNGITNEQLDHIFAIDGKVIEVIAAKLPGKSKRQQTVEAYILGGLQSFLKAGEPTFTDKEARDICVKVGCYDQGNHFNYVKALKNLVSGSKETGWKLSNPGLVEAAKLVKTLAPPSHA